MAESTASQLPSLGEVFKNVKFLDDVIYQKEANFFCANLLVNNKRPDRKDAVAFAEYKKIKKQSDGEVDMVVSGSISERFDLRDLVVAGKRSSLQQISQDCDFMCVYKHYIVDETCDEGHHVLVRFPCGDSHGFSYIKKVGCLQGNIMETIFDQCLDGECFLLSSKIMNLSDDISLETPRKEGMENLDTFQPGPAIMVDVYGGMEFKSIDTGTDQGVGDLVRLLKAMDERKEMEPEKGPSDDLQAKYKSTDFVIAFPLKTWPSEADNFFIRKRPSNWPNDETLNKVKETDCFLVCIGSHLPKSELKDRQFRLSFSKAEMSLAISLSDEQNHCYRWAKLILKLHLSTPKVLSSYHLKTLFFWFCEKVPVDSFSAEGEKMLINFFEFVKETCQELDIKNYFIPSNNMIAHLPHRDVQEFVSRIGNVQKTMIEKMIYLNEAVKTYTIKETLADAHLRLSRGLFADEEEFWKYVLDWLHGHEFSDSDIEAMHRASQNYGQDHPQFLKKEPVLTQVC